MKGGLRATKISACDDVRFAGGRRHRRSFRRARPRPQDASPVHRGVRLPHHGARRRAGADRALGGEQADRPARGRPRRRAAGAGAARRRADAGGARPPRARARRRLRDRPDRRRRGVVRLRPRHRPRPPARDARRRSPKACSATSPRSCASRRTKASASTSRSASRAISSATSTTAARSLGVCDEEADLRGLARRPYRRDRLVLAVYAGHALAGRASVRFAETLAFEHVGLPPSTAVHALLQREAARLDRAVPYRTVVSTFDAALRVVAANLGVGVVPLGVAGRSPVAVDLQLIPIADAWAERGFVLCFRSLDALPPAARRLADHLAAHVDCRAS